MKQPGRRKFTDEEKRAIVDAAYRRGINVVLQEHRLSYSVFSRWKAKFLPDEMKEQKEKSQIIHQLKELMNENETLRRIVANQALELQVKTERLNKDSF